MFLPNRPPVSEACELAGAEGREHARRTRSRTRRPPARPEQGVLAVRVLAANAVARLPPSAPSRGPPAARAPRAPPRTLRGRRWPPRRARPRACRGPRRARGRTRRRPVRGVTASSSSTVRLHVGDRIVSTPARCQQRRRARPGACLLGVAASRAPRNVRRSSVLQPGGKSTAATPWERRQPAGPRRPGWPEPTVSAAVGEALAADRQGQDGLRSRTAGERGSGAVDGLPRDRAGRRVEAQRLGRGRRSRGRPPRAPSFVLEVLRPSRAPL